MTIRLALAAAGTIFLAASVAAVSQPAPPTSDQGATEGKDANKGSTSTDSSKNSAQADAACDSGTKSVSAKRSGSAQGAKANAKPESVSSITRDTGDQPPARAKKTESAGAC